MSYKSPTSINNQVEYWGLIHGLRYAHKHQFQPLEVVGDSLMITQLQRAHKSPKQPRRSFPTNTSSRGHDQRQRVASSLPGEQ